MSFYVESMDLLDLYHAHDDALLSANYYNEIDNFNINKDVVIKDENENETRSKLKKAKFVPWEPYKAAPAHDRKGVAPSDLPQLIRYPSEPKCSEDIIDSGKPLLVDSRRNKSQAQPLNDNEKVLKLSEDLAASQRELEMERKLNRELKRIMVATISDDLQSQVEALTEDKVRLAHRVEEYYEKLMRDDETCSELRIERDVWQCKYLAQTIRSDELQKKMNVLLNLMKNIQLWIKHAVDKQEIPEEAKHFASADLFPYFNRFDYVSFLQSMLNIKIWGNVVIDFGVELLFGANNSIFRSIHK